MPRKEQFAFGAALVTAALAINLSKSLAWFILILGLGLVFDFYLRDLIWGPDRLTREQIEKMPAEEYKARVLGNPKTEQWVNWLVEGRKAFKKHMRKLAREAVIFILVTPVLAFAVDFGYMYHDAHKQVAANAVYGGWETIPCKDGEQYAEQGRIIWTCQKGVRTATVNNIPRLIPDASKTPQLPPGFTIDLPAGVVPDKTPNAEPTESTLELLKQASLFALYGFPFGLGLWVLYRAIFFAVKG